MNMLLTLLKSWHWHEGPLWLWWYDIYSWIYNCLCNQFLFSLTLWVWIPVRRGVLSTTLCDKVCQWLAADRWFSPGTPVSSSNKTDLHDITEILLKVALKTITLSLTPGIDMLCYIEIWHIDTIKSLVGCRNNTCRLYIDCYSTLKKMKCNLIFQ